MLKMVDGTGIIGVDMICPLGVSTPQPPNYDRVELEGTGMLVLPNSLDAPLERLELGGKTAGKKEVIQAGEFEQGTITAHAGTNYDSNYRVRTKNYINLTSGTYEVTCTGAKLGNVVFYSVENKFEKLLSGTHIPLPIKFTLTENKLVRVLFSNSESTPIVPADIKNAILEADVSPEHQQDIVNSGKWNEETQKYEVDVKITGRNLFNGKLSKGKFITDDMNVVSDLATMNTFDKPVEIEPNTDYVISANGVIWEGNINVYDENGKKIVQHFTGKFKTPSNAKYIRASIANARAPIDSKIQMEYGTAMNEFEQYHQPQVLTITSDRPLTKWDRLVEQGGEIGWLYGTRDVIFTGDESWRRHTETDMSVWFACYNCLPGIKTHNVAQNIGAYSNYALWERELANNRDGKFCTNGNPSNNFLLFGMSKDYTVETFKTWLREKNKSGKPMCLTYPTESTEFVPLPQSEQNAIRALKTYYPTTVITVDGGELDPDIKATYRKEI